MSLMTHLKYRKFRNFRQLFVKDDSGATAVEFALIGPPFIALIVFLLLGAHILWMAHSLDAGVRLVSRQIKTGQAQAANMTLLQFRNDVCDFVVIARNDCRQLLIVDVRRFGAPDQINFNPPRQNGAISQNAADFQPGGSNDYVIVKVYFVVDYLTSVAGLLGGNANFDITLSATAAFRNEPF